MSRTKKPRVNYETLLRLSLRAIDAAYKRHGLKRTAYEVVRVNRPRIGEDAIAVTVVLRSIKPVTAGPRVTRYRVWFMLGYGRRWDLLGAEEVQS